MKEQEIDFSEQINDLKAEDEQSADAQPTDGKALREKIDESIEKYGIDIGFYNNDPKPLIQELEEILVTWEEKSYPTDEAKWKEYFEDILTLVHKRTYNPNHDG